MTSYLIYKIQDSFFGLSVENVVRVINIQNITPIPNSQEYIDGYITFEDKSIQVFNFRNSINIGNKSSE